MLGDKDPGIRFSYPMTLSMTHLRTSIAGLAFIALLTAPSFASTRAHYHRLDKRITAEAQMVLKDSGINTDVVVRSTRGRLIVDGDLTPQQITALKVELVKATGAYSVVVK